MPFPKVTLPANEPGRHDVKLKYPPRGMSSFHTEGVTIRTTKYSVPHIGKPWTYDLIAVPMETVRKTFNFKRTETPRARKNLQVWVDNLGQALYNPVTWRLQEFYKGRKLSPSGRLLKKGLYIRQYDGMHRIRALEALDFNFVYLFLAFGFPTMSKAQRAEIAMLFRPAIHYHMPGVPRRRGCGKCGKPVKWVGSKDARRLVYKCSRCDHTESFTIVYPEPV